MVGTSDFSFTSKIYEEDVIISGSNPLFVLWRNSSTK
jgi:hypothetical protein